MVIFPFWLSQFPVISTHQDQCEHGDVLKISSPNPGNIASITTRETQCGSQSSPWLIEAPQGKQIRITLLDFLDSDSRIDSSVCLMYATVNVGIYWKYVQTQGFKKDGCKYIVYYIYCIKT